MDMLLHKNTMSTDHKQVVEHLLGVQQHQQSKEDVFVVELNRKSSGLGLGLIDGMVGIDMHCLLGFMTLSTVWVLLKQDRTLERG